MNPAEIIHFTTQALTLVLFLSLPPILVAALVGTLVSLVQALTDVRLCRQTDRRHHNPICYHTMAGRRTAFICYLDLG